MSDLSTAIRNLAHEVATGMDMCIDAGDAGDLETLSSVLIQVTKSMIQVSTNVHNLKELSKK